METPTSQKIISSPYTPNVENIIDPYIVMSGDLIEHKSYPGKLLYVTVTGTSITLFENEEDMMHDKKFATAGRTGITKRYRSRLSNENQDIDKAKKKLVFSPKDEKNLVIQKTTDTTTTQVPNQYEYKSLHGSDDNIDVGGIS